MKSAALGLLVLGSVALAAPALAGDKGLYVGADIARSTVDLSKDELDGMLADGLTGAGLDYSAGGSDLEESDTRYGFHVGYRFTPYLAAEVSYLAFGAATYDATGTLSDGESSFDGKVSLDWEVNGIAVSGLGILPVNDTFEVYARLGVLFANTDLSAKATAIDTGDSARISDSDVTEELLWGLGGTLKVSDDWSARLEFSRVVDAGDEDSTGEADIDRITLGVIRTF